MSEQENFNLDDVVSGEKKIQYVDKLELLREKINSTGVLSSRTNKKELIEIVENYNLEFGMDVDKYIKDNSETN